MKHQIADQEVSVESFACPDLLWFGVGLKVIVNGEEIARSTKRFEGLHTKIPFHLQIGSDKKEGCLVSHGVSSVLRTRYKLILEGEQVDEGFVRAKNWYVTYGIILLLCLFLAGIYFSVRHFIPIKPEIAEQNAAHQALNRPNVKNQHDFKH